MKLKINSKLNKLIFISTLLSLNTSFALVDDLFKGMTSLEKPFELRDPFLAPRIKRKVKSKIVGKVSKGTYSNIPVMKAMKLEDVKIIGVIIGKERRAFIKNKKVASGPTYTVKEGDRLGENKAKLRAILPGGIILVEKTTNIYGEDEYLETVIPISK
jgi:type IV pilus assembly protein PilP